MKLKLLLFVSVIVCSFSLSAQQWLGASHPDSLLIRTGGFTVGRTTPQWPGNDFVHFAKHTIVRTAYNGDLLDVVNDQANLPDNSDLIWGALYGPQTGNPGLFTLHSAANPASLVFTVKYNGNVGIGIGTPQNKLDVNGKIRAKEVKVENTNWPDYVFLSNYKLPSLKETELYIKEHGHLEGIPSAELVAKEGLELGANQGTLLKKIEELTLHLIEIDKKFSAQQKDLEEQRRLVKKQATEIIRLKKRVHNSLNQ